MCIQGLKKTIYFIILIVVVLSCKTENEPKSIYVVRHAEKQLDGDDPELTPGGEARAKKLGQLMADKNIDHVYSTNTVRTKATVRYVAQNKGVDVDIYDARDHDELIDKLKSKSGNALVVGHSNTIHHVLNYFSEDQEYSELADLEYNFIFEIKLGKDGTAQIIRKLYKEFDKAD